MAHSRLTRGCLPLFFVVLLFASSASAEWKEKVLYSLQGIPDGVTPVGGIVFDSAGNLYGATQGGGSSSCRSTISQCGTVFQLSPPAKKGDPWTETVLYVFKGNASNDGAMPFGGLVIDSAGNLYGTTGFGGTGNCSVLGTLMGCGTAFELSPPTQRGGVWTETVLYSFESGKDGYLPNGDLVFDSAGNLYGATTYGGSKGTNCGDAYFQFCGTVFELSPPKQKGGKWTEKVLYSFKGGTKGRELGDGGSPNGALILDGADAIYGTTNYGGDESGECEIGSPGQLGCGIVFKLTPPAKKGGTWSESRIRIFTGGKGGGQPSAGVIFDAKGSLYGVAGGGNPSGGGIVFCLTAAGGKQRKETVLHWFSNSDVGPPVGGVTFGTGGSLYGTTTGGDSSPSGTVFKLKPPLKHGGAWHETTLYGFKGSPDGNTPAASVIFDAAGNLFGTTTEGGAGTCGYFGCGTVFEVSP